MKFDKAVKRIRRNGFGKTMISLALTKPNRSQIVAALARKMWPFEEPERWLFVVGCYNSGTTLLLNLLAQHPSVSHMDGYADQT